MQVTVEPELAHGGAAIARVEGRVVFVEGAAPGETVGAVSASAPKPTAAPHVSMVGRDWGWLFPLAWSI